MRRLSETGKLGKPRISLRPVRIEDSADIFEGIAQGDLLPAVPGSDRVRSTSDAAGMLAGLIGRMDRGDEFHFSVCLDGDRVVGMCAIYDFMPDGSARVGYWIGRGYRRRGFGREAVRQLSEFAFAELGVRRVVAVSGASNEASLRLLSSLGFKEEMGKGGNGEKAFSLERGR